MFYDDDDDDDDVDDDVYVFYSCVKFTRQRAIMCVASA